MAEPPATIPSAAPAAPDALLATKLHVPRTRSSFVVRPRLADRLAPAHEEVVPVPVEVEVAVPAR